MNMFSKEFEILLTNEVEYHLRRAEKVSLGVSQDIDRESVSKLNERLASRGIEIIYENGHVYAIDNFDIKL